MAKWDELENEILDPDGDDPLAKDVFASIEDCMGNIWRNERGAIRTRGIFVDELNVTQFPMTRISPHA